MENQTRDIVVIGGSAGAIEAMLQLVTKLPADFAAALLVVMHVGPHPSQLPQLLSKRGPLPGMHPVGGELPERGKIYIAPPDHHLTICEGRLHLSRGPKENWTRPAIDPLFRSTALAFGSRVIGVILSGTLNDGSAGLKAVADMGGIAVVQDPVDAAWGEMPRNAMRSVTVDHCVPLEALASLLVKLTMQQPSAQQPKPFSVENLRIEHEMSVDKAPSIDLLKRIAHPSTFGCPECRGVLWRLNAGSPQRYRCHTGHAYTALTLAHLHAQGTEGALRDALRAVHEQRELLRLVHEDAVSERDTMQIADVAKRLADVDALERSLLLLIEA